MNIELFPHWKYSLKYGLFRLFLIEYLGKGRVDNTSRYFNFDLSIQLYPKKIIDLYWLPTIVTSFQLWRCYRIEIKLLSICLTIHYNH